MNILFTICGRAGSKGIKNKNIRKFNGKPLVYYTLSVMDLFLRSNSDNTIDIALNTDSNELRLLVQKYERLNIDFIPRKEELAEDKVAKRDVIIDTLHKMELQKNRCYDIVIDLDITSPLRTLKNLKDAVGKQIQTQADVVFSVTSSRRNPYFNMVMRSDRGYGKVIESSYTTRQEAPVVFDMNASIYVYKADHLSSGKGVLEGYNEIILMEDTGILDLDNESDFALMEVISQYLVENNIQFREIYNNIME